jgi:glutamate/tyrosine decarboxylase-like PLP-dependent enzyme
MSQHLFPSAEYRKTVDNSLTTLLSDVQQRVIDGSVVPTFDVSKCREQLAQYNFAQAVPLEQAIAWTLAQMEHGLVHINHPRYFGLFNPTPTFPAQIADRIVASFNPQLATWTSSPAAVEIESHVIRAVTTRVGFPAESRGHFTTGGSEANYTAVIMALTKACPEYATEGVRAFTGQPIIYVSKDCHLAWLKIAHQAGLGRSAIRLIGTDGKGRMDGAALLDAMTNDRWAGRVPLMIVATAGTTNAGMIDPLEMCGVMARQYNLWYHVDAAWGGGLIASEKFRERLHGIERADSVTIDAHKWFATTMGCGIFITRWPTVLSTAFSALNSFMPSNNVELDPYVSTVQWSRRFLGLRLFFSLLAAGWEGYGQHVEHALRLINLLKEQLIEQGWVVLNASLVGVLCVVPPSNGSVRVIVDQVVKSGKAWVSVAMFEGREVIRACVTSGTTTEEDVFALVTALVEANETNL